MSLKPTRLSELYQRNPKLQRLYRQVQHLNALEQQIIQMLPPQFVSHCQLGHVHDDTVVLITDKAALATLLRYQSARLSKQLSDKLGLPIRRVSVKVRPLQQINAAPPPRLNKSLTSQNARLLHDSAQSIDHPPLRRAMERLAARKLR